MKKRSKILIITLFALVMLAFLGTSISAAEIRPGDMNGDATVNVDDAIYLLRHTFKQADYPISQSGDVNGDGTVNVDDAIYLLRHTFKPDDYPIFSGNDTQYSVGLEFTSNGDGTCYVSGIGRCKDADIVIPPTSPAGDSVTSIGFRAFYDCDKLTSVIIGNSVTSIDTSAFAYCTSLTYIEIPDSVTSIDGNAFYNTALYNDESNWKNGVLYIGNHLIKAQNTISGEYEIKQGTLTIVGYAFESCTNLTSVVIPDSVTSIGRYAFYNTALYNDESNWKNGVLYIGNHLIKAQNTISGEYEIKQGTLTIADYAFESCPNLTSVVIPNSVTNIGDYAFGWCWDLTSVVIPDSVTSIGDAAFFLCESLASIDIPDSVTSIGNSTFCGCESLTSVVIPDSVTSIGDEAFDDCSSLASIDIPDSVTSIGDEAFEFCSSLTSIVIPDSVMSIGERAFRYCYSLASVVIGNSVTSIGDEAFNSCFSLASINIPDSVTSIGDSTFSICASLTSITVAKDNDNYKSIDGNLYSKDGKTLIQYALGKTNTEFNIPDSVTSIGDLAFAYCDSLNSVVIPDSVTSIGDLAFRGTALYKNESNWENGVLYIGNHLIKAKDTISSEYTIKQGTVTIADRAFYDCSSLTSVVIPDSVTSIGDRAFFACSSLTSVVIGDSVTSIVDSAFGRCWNLASITVSEDNAYYKSINDNLYTKEGTTLIRYAAAKIDTEFTIPDSVTSIGEGAFDCCSNLTSIVIPDSVTSIGEGAFDVCDNLTDVYYTGSEDDWSKIEIGRHNGNLTNATIYYNYNSSDDSNSYSEGLEFTSNGDGTCYVSGIGSCTDTDVVIPNISPDGDSVTSIGYEAFAYCNSLSSVVIPDSVTSIGDWAFVCCFSLTSAIIPDSVTSIGDYAFNYCTSLSSVVIGDSVTSISYSAFCYCYSLTSITVDMANEYYESIDGNLYTKGGGTLVQYAIGKTDTEFTIPSSVTNIGDWAFCGCTSLSSVVIGNSVTSIGADAFCACTSLSSVVIPDSVTIIDGWAFAYCDSLSSVVIPDSVTSIGYRAFYGCESLESITVDSENEYYKSIDGNLYTKDGKTLIQYAVGKTNTEFTVPESVTNIGGYAFAYCTSLNSVIIGDSVTDIAWGAFSYCTNLSSVEIPASMIRIGDYVFEYCESLTDVYYDGNAQDFSNITVGNGNEYFTNATIHYDSNEVTYSTGLAFTPNGNGTCYVSGIGDCTDVNVAIPTTSPDGDRVTGIGESAFYQCDSLISVIIPDSVTSIGEGAFYGCSSLRSVEIGSGLRTIGDMAFYLSSSISSITVNSRNENYKSIDGNLYTIDGKILVQYAVGKTATEFTIPDGVSTISAYAFAYCKSLIYVDIPNGVTYIGDEAFSDCVKLSSIQIPDGVTYIGTYAFAFCEKLSSIEIPGSVTDIGAYAFQWCENLSSVKIGNGVTSIGYYAFSYCSSLVSIEIPVSVTSISTLAFYWCDSLTDVYYGGSEADWQNIVIGYSNQDLTNATIHYNYAG